MIGAFFYSPNGKAFAIFGRSGSYSITLAAATNKQKPEAWPNDKQWHPIYSLKSKPLDQCDISKGLAVMVRDPIERFRSACGYKNISPNEAFPDIMDPAFRSLEQAGLIRNDITYFLFPNGLNECANWLGLPTPISHENQAIQKPDLTLEQVDKINIWYEKDIDLYNKLIATT